MRRRMLFKVLSVVWILVGCQHCALTSIQEQNRQSEGRIFAKEQELRDLETERRILDEERERLLWELDSRRMTLDELSTRLDRLRRQNARLKADTERERRKKADIDMQIAQYQREIDALEQNDQMAISQKTKKIEELKARIRALLKIM